MKTRLLALASIVLLIPVSQAFAQGMDMGNMTMNQTNSQIMHSPAALTTEKNNVQVKLSWVEPINATDSRGTQFTVEFWNASTGQRLSNVTYSIHMLIDGASAGHIHDLNATNGADKVNVKFNSTGTLSLFVEILKVGNTSMDQTVQFNSAVAPELPLAPVSLAGAISLIAIIQLTRRRQIKSAF